MVTGSKSSLWSRIKYYKFESLVPPGMMDHLAEAFGSSDASTRAFASKIANKHRWSRNFARRAVSEYKKFVYLGIVGNKNPTPSKVIDVVWHEHMLFTRGYRNFCETVLGRNFDHYPELIPSDEQTHVYARQYAETLQFYRLEFGSNPPADIWGETKFESEKQKKKKGKRSNLDLDLEIEIPKDWLTSLFEPDFAGQLPVHESCPELMGTTGWESGGAAVEASSDSGGGDSGGASCGVSGGGGGCSSGCGGGGD